MVRILIYSLAVIFFSTPTAHAAEQRALLELRINETKKGVVGVFLRGDDVLTQIADLEQNGVRIAGGHHVTIREIKYVSLKSLAPTIKFRIDEKDLSLRLTALLPPIETKNGGARNQTNDETSPSQISDPAPKEIAKQPSPHQPSNQNTDVSVARDKGKAQNAFLELKVNMLKKNEIPVVIRDHDVLGRVSDLENAGIVGFQGQREQIRGEQYVSLRSLEPKLAYQINETDLSLDLTVSPSLLGLNVISSNQDRPEKIDYRQNPSVFLNYALFAENMKNVTVFSETGVNLKNSLLYSSLSRNPDGQIVRGLSNVTISNRDNLNRTVIGDRLLATDVLGGSLTMGGIGYFREFAIDPYFTRSPGLHYSGAVSTPSTLDVYVNGQFLRRLQLPPGQFELKDLPVPTGSADTRLVLRDAFGREQEFLAPYYFTQGLLQNGLHEFSYNFGAPRKNLATENWHYDAPVFLGRHRFGFSDALTAGMRLEASPKMVSGGPSVSFRLPIGEMELATAASHETGLSGGAAYVGYSWNGQLFNIGTSARLFSPHYSTASLSASAKRSWLQTNTALGFNIGDRIGVTMRHTVENSEDTGLSHRYALATTLQLKKWVTLFIRGGYLQERNKNSLEITTGLNFQLADVLGTLSHERVDGVGTSLLSVQKTTPSDNGFGYRLTGKTTEGRYATDSQVQYQGPYGNYDAFHTYAGGTHGSQLRAAGGLVYLGGDFAFTRPIQDSFAMINVPGLKGIRGYVNNQEIGRSDSKGNLLVPNLLPYYGNKLRIADQDIPLNYNIDVIEYVVATPYRGGAVVTFPVNKIQRVMGTVVIEKGGVVTIPLHGQLTVSVATKSFESPIGRKGEFYLENLPSGSHKAVILHEQKSCEFQLTVPETAESDIKIGNLRCTLP